MDSPPQRSGRGPHVLRHYTALALAAGVLLVAPGSAAAQQPNYASLARNGVALAQSRYADNSHGLWNGKVNVPFRWYDERLGVHSRYPLATIWGVLPLWESLSALAIADPSYKPALAAFSKGPHAAAAGPRAVVANTSKPKPRRRRRHRRHHAPMIRLFGGAESYWNASERGYSPYPGDRGMLNTWFDDNAWWGLGFMDAFWALGDSRYLADAQNALDFIDRRGWDTAGGGGIWWNTDHSPAGQKAGEPLAAGALLAALLAQADLAKAASGSARAADVRAGTADLAVAKKFLTWGDAHFAGPGGLYWRTNADPTPTPYIAGPTVEAKQILCQLEPGSSYCAQARALADAAYQRFADRLNMGPQFDTIYLRWMLVYGQQVHDGRWLALAREMAANALQNSLDQRTGLYLRAWDGSDMSGHQADPNMLRTDAATVELFAWLASAGA